MRPPSVLRRHPNASVALLSIALLLVLLVVAEAVVGLFNSGGDAFATDVPDDWTALDRAGVERARPSASFRFAQRLRATGEPIFDVIMNTDEFGRRRVPLEGREARDRFLLLFGGSFVEGWGLEDDETLPAQIATRTRRTMPYNYGFHGHGPAEALVRLESDTLRDEVAEREGLLLYFFTDADRDRSIGSLRIVAGPVGPGKPYYRLDGTRGVVRDGSFASGRPLRTRLYQLLGRSRLLSAAKLDLRPGSSEDHYRLVAAILAATRDRFAEQFPGQRFVVLIFPGSRRGGPLVAELERLGVTTLDWAGSPGLPPELTLGKGDPHPSRRANAALAERLMEALDLT